ncbi:MAG: flagellar protein FliO/FliZ [Pseudonocardiales bacterium]|nr:flagellar protein FliO/FliZ [Pseudonocardiales bacterium]MDT4945342.1 flagellar protein FliO/FliZ [Pseudonocardiales bacterium]
MDTVALVGRLLVSLAAVLGLMWLLARRVKRPARGKSSRLIDVLGRQQLSRTSSVTVVRVMDQALILGVTDGQVTVIGEADLDAVHERLEAATAQRTVRAARPSVASHLPATAPSSAPSTVAPMAPSAVPAGGALAGSALAGSALSLKTWRQTIETLRDLTARSR